MPRIVSIDIETTGLDPDHDSIIEIGAILFNERRVEAEWSSLINPQQPIPSPITALTGITNDMVRNAPAIDDVIDNLVKFVGTYPILGHNIQFDLSFLRKHNIFIFNDSLDTYEMASVLLPKVPRYNLKSLGQELGILFPATHRALDDARVTHGVFMKLWEKAKVIPLELVQELVQFSESFDWGGSWVFYEMLEHSPQPRTGNSTRFKIDYTQFQKCTIPLEYPPLNPQETLEKLDPEEVAGYLDYGGKFAQYFMGYEHRPEQIEMVRAVTAALSESQHLLIEAGTGVGKSFAYLVPAALWSIKNQHRVVISTNTINLQEQLITKDIPDLSKALDLNLNTAILKGRANYLCPRRLDILRQRGPESIEQLRVLGKILVWLYEGGCGDRNEINLNGMVEREVWSRISAADDTCQAENCIERTSGNCPFYLSRQAAQNAHLIIVNHALLLADVATGNRVLPDYNYLIVDEGHHIEAATTGALTFRITQGEINRLLHELGGTSSGILGFFLLNLRGILNPAEYANLYKQVNGISELVFRLEHGMKDFFLILEEFLAEQREHRPVSVYGQQERITAATCTLPLWSKVEISWGDNRNILDQLSIAVNQLHQSAINIVERSDDLFDLIDQLGGIKQRLQEMDDRLSSFVSGPKSDHIYWLDLSAQTRTMAINIAPLQIGPLMEKYLWHEKESVILTSATLTTHEGFDYIINSLFASDASTVALGSPFDYETSALLYITNDIPEPNQGPDYQKSVDQTIIRLAKTVGGRMMVLFTSYAQLKKTSQNISSALMDLDITIYEQGMGSSPNILLESFRSSDKAILLGTKSFWEGVDIPGEALSVLVIVKLPFDVPSDPIIAARSELFDDPFNEYNLPEAILRFRQGFGRLIRTKSDRGVVVILDRRILTKRYGRSFIESLPECKTQIGSLRDLPGIAARWLNI